MQIYVFELSPGQNHKEQSEYCINKLKEICVDEYGMVRDDLEILRTDDGKPYFSKVDLQFNISHSKGMAAIVIDNNKCGIDIEKIRETDFKIANRFFNDNEKNYINQSVSIEEKTKRFFEIWTGKEAYTKYLGCGLRLKMNSFDVLSKNISGLLSYQEKNGYMICVCKE